MRRARIHLLTAVIFTSIAFPAPAQPVTAPATFSPAAPSSAHPIAATFAIPGGCSSTFETVVSGTVVRTAVDQFGCVIGPPAVPEIVTIEFGPLPANAYSYEIYYTFQGGPPSLRSQQPLVVGAASVPIPLLEPFVSLLLALALAAVAIAILR